ncbi:hemerythrin domain-containing protein [Streptomyces ossamyceticus]|uniref:Hemerythrin domain-containing protein n=1 Tax=Streptomyces ossamyceticus TaxID=249581 RepID=A0ABV2V1K4_9ACTN
MRSFRSTGPEGRRGWPGTRRGLPRCDLQGNRCPAASTACGPGASRGKERRDAFRRLVRLAAVHETAEEKVVHCFARSALPGGGHVVDDRLAEKRAAKEILADLDDLATDGPTFPPRLMPLRTEVREHARAEERHEFPRRCRGAGPGRRAPMARAVEAAEARAPTRPHPGIESPAANPTLGPVAALADRTKDAVREAMGKDG